MKLNDHYEHLWDNALQQFESGNIETDKLIDSPDDTRYGLTLLARPCADVKQATTQVLEEIRSVAPDQYYYPSSDRHLTVLSIISCYSSFSLSHIDTQTYTKLIASILASAKPIEIKFEGLTASPSCIMIRGYPVNDSLDQIRNELRKAFKNSSLQHSIDKRYRIKTAHVTVIRFKKELSDPARFTTKIKSLKKNSFGSCVLDELELTGNDWYQRKAQSKPIAKFDLT